MKKGFTPIIILLVLLIVALVGIAYFAGTKGIFTNRTPLVLYSSPPPSPSPDLTVGWTDYLRYADFYTFKYPSNFGEQGVVGGPISGSPKFIRTFSDPSTIREGTDAPFDGFSLYSVASIGDLSFQDYIKREKDSFKNNPRGEPVGGVAEKTITVDGQVVISLAVEENITLFYVPIPNSKSLIVFSRINTNTSFIDVFNQILSTFKFSKIKQTGCTFGFAQYTNENLSICYPADMAVANEYHPYVNDPNVKASTTTLSNSNEKFVVNTSFVGGWGGGAITEQTTVSGYPTTILVFKDQSGNIINLVAVVGDRNFSTKFPIAIDYQQKSQSYFLDRGKFNIVINSLNLK